MILLHIYDVKKIMTYLLMQDVFDDFCLEEMQILTGARLEVNGHRNISWYDADEREKGLTEYIRWKEIREIAFMYIKGRKTPQSFVISFHLTQEEASRLLKDPDLLKMKAGDNADFFLQLRYIKEELSVLTGISYKTFVLEKNLEFAWDDAVKKLFRNIKIAYGE